MVQAAPGIGPSLPGSSQHRGPRGCTRWAAVPTKSPPSNTRIELSGKVSSTSCSTHTGLRCWATGIIAFSLQWSSAGQQDQQQTLLGTHHPPRPPAPTERTAPSAGQLAEAPLPSLRPMSGPEGPPPASIQRSPHLLGKEEGTAAERWPPPALPAQEAQRQHEANSNTGTGGKEAGQRHYLGKRGKTHPRACWNQVRAAGVKGRARLEKQDLGSTKWIRNPSQPRLPPHHTSDNAVLSILPLKDH